MSATNQTKRATGCPAAAGAEQAERPAHGFGSLGSLTGFSIRCMHQYLSGGLADIVDKEGLKPHQFTALSVVVDNATISQSDLARALGIKPSNIVPLIDEMEARGLVQRNAAAGNRRTYALVATDRGRDLRDRALARIAAYEDELLAFLSKDERAMLLALHERIPAR